MDGDRWMGLQIMDKEVNKQMDGWIDRQMGKLINGWIDGCME